MQLSWQFMSPSERTTRIRELNKIEGKTATEIGTLLDTTKSAVLSHVHRHNLVFIDQKNGRLRARGTARVARKQREDEQRAARREKLELERAARDAAQRERVAAQAEADRIAKMPAWAPLPGSKGVELWQTEPTPTRPGALCCWPVWGGDDEPKLYCGEVIGNKNYSYCPTHLRRAYPAGPPGAYRERC